MPRCHLLSLTFVLGTVGCQSTVLADLDDFCRVVSEVEKDSSMTPDQKLDRLEARRSEYARPPALGSLDIWAKLKEYSGEDKYKWLMTAARTEGRIDWRCSSYAKLLTAVDFARIAKKKPEEAPTMASATTSAKPTAKPTAQATGQPKAAPLPPVKKPAAASPKKSKSGRGKHRR